MLNGDELVLNGHGGIYSAIWSDNNKISYPYTSSSNFWYWTMTPCFIGEDGKFLVDILTVSYTYGALEANYARTAGAIVPVINLNSETAQSLIGTCSKEDPSRLAE